MANPWSFWIDVGGTFTDCLARNPNGVVHTHKLLSTGEYRGHVAAGSNRTRIVDPQRRGDPQGFFDAGRDDEIGYRLTLRRPDRRGRVQVLDQQAIRRFDAKEGFFWLDRPLAIDPTPDLAYAVTSGESAPLVGIRWLMGKRIGEPIGPVSVRLGNHPRNQCPARASRGSDGAGHHGRVRRRLAHRIPEPAPLVRSAHPPARSAVQRRGRGRRAP